MDRIVVCCIYQISVWPPQETQDNRRHLQRPHCFARAIAQSTVPAMMQAMGETLVQEIRHLSEVVVDKPTRPREEDVQRQLAL